MSKKDWLYIILGYLAGGVSIFLARWLYKRLKEGAFDKYLKEEEKETLIDEIQEFLRDYDEEQKKGGK